MLGQPFCYTDILKQMLGQPFCYADILKQIVFLSFIEADILFPSFFNADNSINGLCMLCAQNWVFKDRNSKNDSQEIIHVLSLEFKTFFCISDMCRAFSMAFASCVLSIVSSKTVQVKMIFSRDFMSWALNSKRVIALVTCVVHFEWPLHLVCSALSLQR